MNRLLSVYLLCFLKCMIPVINRKFFPTAEKHSPLNRDINFQNERERRCKMFNVIEIIGGL